MSRLEDVLTRCDAWDESRHPRDEDGRWAESAGARGSSGTESSGGPQRASSSEPMFSYTPDRKLAPAQKAIERRFGQAIERDYRGMKAQYAGIKDTRGGKVLNTDTARELSPDYLEDRTQSAAVHEPASAFVKHLYAEKLAEAPKEGEEPLVAFTGGGTGAGKTTAVNQLFGDLESRSQIIYDTNLNGLESTERKIDQALAAGKRVNILYVHADPAKAAGNAVARAVRQAQEHGGTGRTVPIDTHIATHMGANETIRKVAERYADDPRVTIRLIDNSGEAGSAKEIKLEELPKFDYNSVRRNAYAELERARAEGVRGKNGERLPVSERIYRGFKGQGSGAGETGRSVALGGHRESESQRQGARADQLAAGDEQLSGHSAPTSPGSPSSEGETLRASGILFLADDGQVLLIRRTDGLGWAFPGGGIEGDESAEECARRETLEETGVEFDGPLSPWTRRIKDGVDFTTFVARCEQFIPDLNGEHDIFTWAAPDTALATLPVHPGAAVALKRFDMNELDIARAIRDQELVSPQRYDNVLLVAIRITGTGAAYRAGIDEYVWRDPSLYMNDEFLERCQGLTVIWEHPKKRMMNSKEFNRRVVGSVMLPYLKPEQQEVWGIAKIYDEEAADALSTEQWSTSPGVKLKTSVSHKNEDGSKLLLEGDLKLLDHIAVCTLGVWDKAGPASGVDAVLDSASEPLVLDQILDKIYTREIESRC